MKKKDIHEKQFYVLKEFYYLGKRQIECYVSTQNISFFYSLDSNETLTTDCLFY